MIPSTLLFAYALVYSCLKLNLMCAYESENLPPQNSQKHQIVAVQGDFGLRKRPDHDQLSTSHLSQTFHSLLNHPTFPTRTASRDRSLGFQVGGGRSPYQYHYYCPVKVAGAGHCRWRVTTTFDASHSRAICIFTPPTSSNVVSSKRQLQAGQPLHLISRPY